MSSSSRSLGFATRCIHAGQEPDPSTGAVMPPIYTTSTYAQSSPGVHKGYDYSRTRNPTRNAWERCIADLEGGARGFAFASGMAATSTVIELLDAGSHIVAMDDLYGGTFRLFERVRRRTANLDITFADLSSMEALQAAVRPKTRMIWIETPTNPTLRLVDIAQVAEFAHKRGILTVVDNTFASPYIQRPIELGADLVVHSATKYLNGHSDMVGGVAVALRAPTRTPPAPSPRPVTRRRTPPTPSPPRPAKDLPARPVVVVAAVAAAAVRTWEMPRTIPAPRSSSGSASPAAPGPPPTR